MAHTPSASFFGAAGEVTAAVRRATDLPLLVKLSPNVADVRPIARAIADAGAELAATTTITVVPGDVADRAHRRALVDAAVAMGGGHGIDAVVNNASLLGPSPQPALADYPLDTLRGVYEANVLAPLGLLQLALPRLSEGAAVLDITSDAGVEAYAFTFG